MTTPRSSPGAGAPRPSTASSAAEPSPSAVRTIAAPGRAGPHESAATLPVSTAEATTALAEAASTGRITVLPRVVGDETDLRLEANARARYSVQRSLGAGAMGEVELGEDHDIGRPIALKRMATAQPSAAAVARFVDEVRTMGALDHPNITPIYDVGRDERGRLFFTMKYVEGLSLEDLVAKLAEGDAATHAQFPLARRLDIFVAILNALEHAHAQNVLHRDIKPANVMLGVHGEVRLVDWGIARRDSTTREAGANDVAERPDMTTDGALLGTPLYMSPEQARGDRAAIDARSDLYSAFVVLFELLTLRRYVSETSSVFATLEKVAEAEPFAADAAVWLHPTQDPVPAELRHFVRHGLQRDPARRFQTAEEALLVLERIRSGDFAVQCPITALKVVQGRLGRFADARPRTLVQLGVALVAVLVVLVVLAVVGVASLL